MFKDRYRTDNDQIEPDEALLKSLSARMKEAAGEAPAPEKKRSHIRIRSAAALAACFVFAVTGISVCKAYDKNKNMENTDLAAEYAQPDYDKATSVSSYDQLYALVNSIRSQNTRAYPENSDRATADAGGNTKTESAGMYSADTLVNSSDTGSYSQTNIQVDGVDEADIVKTDGRYIYRLTNNTVIITDTEGGRLNIVSRIPCGGANEIYVKDNRLIILQNQAAAVNGTGDTVNGSAQSRMAPADITQAAVYDITDKSKPVLIGTPGQSGSYLSSRMVGDTLYLVSNYFVGYSVEKGRPETYVPKLYDGENGSLMAPGDICISANPREIRYAVVSAINVQKPEILSSQSVLGCGTQLYSNESSLYIASEVMQTAKTGSNSASGVAVTYKTNLIRISLNNGQVAMAAEGSVPGTLLNQYSMDEYNGTFRLVTTDSGYTQTTNGNGSISASQNESTNALYTLDQNLSIVGSITDIAKGERVYSVRFNGAIGYFVTFRQVDPLFAVDLSNPANPKILSALKIPGLSDYLHPYADGLLFGLGRDADENTGHVNGLKLSMFDVSDPSSITEKNKLLLDDRYSAASYDYKAIVISPERNLIAFPAENEYLIFSYSADTGFTEKAELSPGPLVYDTRGLFIGNIFYVVSDSAITSYRMDDYNQIAAVNF